MAFVTFNGIQTTSALVSKVYCFSLDTTDYKEHQSASQEDKDCFALCKFIYLFSSVNLVTISPVTSRRISIIFKLCCRLVPREPTFMRVKKRAMMRQ